MASENVCIICTTSQISFVLLGIEEIGIFLEEPFSVLALEHLCRGCEDTIRSMHKGDDNILETLKKSMV